MSEATKPRTAYITVKLNFWHRLYVFFGGKIKIELECPEGYLPDVTVSASTRKED